MSEHDSFELKGEISIVRKRTYCIDCHQLVSGEENGSCGKYPWLISMKLAKTDKVCSYDSFKNKLSGLPEPHIHDNFDEE